MYGQRESTFFAFIMIGQIRADRKRSGRGPRARIRTRDARCTTALYVGALPTRLSVLTRIHFYWRFRPSNKWLHLAYYLLVVTFIEGHYLTQDVDGTVTGQQNGHRSEVITTGQPSLGWPNILAIFGTKVEWWGLDKICNWKQATLSEAWHLAYGMKTSSWSTANTVALSQSLKHHGYNKWVGKKMM